MRKKCDSPAAMFLNGLVELCRRAIQHLPVTFPAQQHMIEIALQQRLILFRVLRSGLCKSQSFHHTYTAFTQSICRQSEGLWLSLARGCAVCNCAPQIT